MSNMEIELNGADQTASVEANAANVAEDVDSSEEDSLVDYSEEEQIQAEITRLEAEQKLAQQKALKEMLANNGFAYRNILRSEKVKQHFTSPFSKENAMSPEDILLEIPKEDLHEVGLVQRRMYMPASFVQKWIIPTIRARNALNGQGTQLPGGYETAMLFSIFDQSILDTTKPRQQLDDDDHALRAIIACAQDANIKLIERMRQGNDGLKEIARNSLKQLEQAVQIPPHHTLWNMSDIDYRYHQETIADAIQQYRGHTERDLEDLQLLREQTALQASLIWEQQMQICKMNEAYLQLSDEKERIVLAENRLAHEGMRHISEMMASLQQSLQKRHEVLAANMDPINSPMIAETIRKLKTALRELHTRNSHLVMHHNELQLFQTFVPPEMGDVMERARLERSHYYENQRVDPHYLHLSGGEYIFMRCETSDMLADKIRRCATVTSIKDLLNEADETLEYLKSHNGSVDPPINDDENIVEDAIHMQLDDGANTAPVGGIPTATPIDTPTVGATPTMRLRMIQTIQQSNDSATKRTHSNTVPTGHTVQPSKVQRMSSQGNLSTFTGMSAHGAQVHMSNVEPPMDTSNPFAPASTGCCRIQHNAR